MFRQVFLFVYDEFVIYSMSSLEFFKGMIATYIKKSIKPRNLRSIPITMNALVLL